MRPWKSFIYGLLLAGLILGSAVAPAAEAPQVLGSRETLKNGLVWVFSEQRSLPLVTLNLLIKGGVLRDPEGKAGLANLTASLLLQGTQSRSATQIAQEADFLGAKLSSGGGDDFCQMSLTVLKKDLGPGLKLFQDVLLNPKFALEEIRRKTAQIQASFKSDEDEPGIVASRAFERRLFSPHPYAHPPKGTPAGVAAITRPDLAAFHRTYFRPNNAILTLAGDLSKEEAARWVEQTFGGWQPAPVPEVKAPPPPPLNKPEVLVVNKNISQANIIWGHLGIARGNPDFYPFQVMNFILGGGGFTSRLMDNIRENRGLAYSVRSGFDPTLEPGSFTIVLETKNASAAEALAQVLKEMDRLRTAPVADAELADAKSYLIGSFPQKMDSLSKRASLTGYVEFYGLGLDYPWRYPGLIRDLTPADIRQVASKYLHPDRYLLVVVGNRAEMPNLEAPSPSSGAKEKSDAGKTSHP